MNSAHPHSNINVFEGAIEQFQQQVIKIEEEILQTNRLERTRTNDIKKVSADLDSEIVIFNL